MRPDRLRLAGTRHIRQAVELRFKIDLVSAPVSSLSQLAAKFSQDTRRTSSVLSSAILWHWAAYAVYELRDTTRPQINASTFHGVLHDALSAGRSDGSACGHSRKPRIRGCRMQGFGEMAARGVLQTAVNRTSPPRYGSAQAVETQASRRVMPSLRRTPPFLTRHGLYANQSRCRYRFPWPDPRPAVPTVPQSEHTTRAHARVHGRPRAGRPWPVQDIVAHAFPAVDRKFPSTGSLLGLGACWDCAPGRREAALMRERKRQCNVPDIRQWGRCRRETSEFLSRLTVSRWRRQVHVPRAEVALRSSRSSRPPFQASSRRASTRRTAAPRSPHSQQVGGSSPRIADRLPST
jgi:hypothetical protein